MRPVVVTAVLLLVVLMFISDSAAGDPAEMCKTKYQPVPCRKNIGEGWSHLRENICVKAFYNTEHLTHSDAEKACKKYPNGHLVSLHHDIGLCKVICAMYRATPRKANYWIGYYLNVGVGKRNWAWTDNSKVGYTKWAPRQPDNYLLRENCVEMNYLDWGLWNDASCNDKKPYVCAVKFE